MFYDHFMKMKKYKKTEDILSKCLKYQTFRTYLQKEMGVSSQLVKILASGVMIRKPYRLLMDDENFFVAVDMNTNLYCIYYKNIMMIDIDTEKTSITLEEIIEKCKLKGDTYIIYKSKNGYHIFVANRTFEIETAEVIDYMLFFDCDINYIAISYKLGWSVRINKKDVEDTMYTYVMSIGDNFLHKDIIDLHFKLSQESFPIMYEKPNNDLLTIE